MGTSCKTIVQIPDSHDPLWRKKNKLEFIFIFDVLTVYFKVILKTKTI